MGVLAVEEPADLSKGLTFVDPFAVGSVELSTGVDFAKSVLPKTGLQEVVEFVV